MTGTFKQGIVVTRKPTNMPRTSVISGWQANTVFFTDIASPDFVWDAYFSYIYNNNLLTQLMSAGVDFES
jgi:hypothetical protein